MSKAQGSFSIGGVSTSVSSVLDAKPPSDDDAERFLARFRGWVDRSRSLTEAIDRSVTADEHPWFLLVLAAGKHWLKASPQAWQENSEEEFNSAVSGALDLQLGQQAPESLYHMAHDFSRWLRYERKRFIIEGGVSSSLADFCMSVRPSWEGIARCWSRVGQASESESIAERLLSVAERTKHPWLRTFLCFARPGLPDALEVALHIRKQIEEIGRAVRNSSSDVKADGTGRSREVGFFVTDSDGGSQQLDTSEEVYKIAPEVTCIPNVLGFFSVELAMIGASSDLRTCFRSLSDFRMIAARDTSKRNIQWNRDVQHVLAALAVMTGCDLPVLRSLRVLQEDPLVRGLREELREIIERIEGGQTLSDAISEVGGRLGKKPIVTAIREGEQDASLAVKLDELASSAV